MSSRYKVTCDKCRYRSVLENPPRTYEFAGGGSLAMAPAPAWCPACATVTWAETLPPLTELQEKLAALERRDPAVIHYLLPFVSPQASLEDLLAKHLAEGRRQVSWRSSRRSPPRCLECGATGIIPMAPARTRKGSDKWSLSPHPDCGGTLNVLAEPAIILSRGWIRYDGEGRRIE